MFQMYALGVNRIVAKAKHVGGSDWVTITVLEQEGAAGELNLDVFFGGEDAGRQADAYADAINKVDRLFLSKKEFAS